MPECRKKRYIGCGLKRIVVDRRISQNRAELAGLVFACSASICNQKSIRRVWFSPGIYYRAGSFPFSIVLAGSRHANLRVFTGIFECIDFVSFRRFSGPLCGIIRVGFVRYSKTAGPVSNDDSLVLGGAGIYSFLYIFRVSLGIDRILPV